MAYNAESIQVRDFRTAARSTPGMYIGADGQDAMFNCFLEILLAILYISKAICAYTGRNFCQFVNYYRIAYAVELFRSNPNMKIVDISSRSGFNSSVSFTMAFRLFMGDKPSDWFRRERAILQKQKGISAR